MFSSKNVPSLFRLKKKEKGSESDSSTSLVSKLSISTKSSNNSSNLSINSAGTDKSSTKSKSKYGTRVKLLGTGTSAKVELYYNKSTNQCYAVKTYRSKESFESSQDYLKRCRTEYDLCKDLKHRNIIQMIDFIKSPSGSKNYQMVVEFIPYSFIKVIKLIKPSTDEILFYFKQLCEGMQYLHNLDICHRDLKLENLVLDSNGCLKIIDFGSVFVSDTKHQELAQGIVGTEVLISPESLANIKYDGFANDIWGLGIVLYCMINFKFPWKSARQSDTEFKEFTQNHDVIKNEFPGEIWALVLRILDIDSASRIDINDLLKQEVMIRIPTFEACPKELYERTLRMCSKRLLDKDVQDLLNLY